MGKKQNQFKAQITYSRDYRHFSTSVGPLVLYLLLCTLPIVLVFVLLYSPLTRAMCLWSGNIVAQITGETVQISSVAFLPGLGDVHFLSLLGSLPSFSHALIAGIITLLAIPIVSQVKTNYRPLMIFLVMGLYVLLCSCVFFVFWPERFPYTLADYSQLYMLQMAALFIILPLLFGVALSLTRARFIPHMTAVVVQLALEAGYNLLRYVVYLVFLRYCSSLYMATLFFTFGVLFDFIQMVTVYSVFAKKLSEQYGSLEGRAGWAW